MQSTLTPRKVTAADATKRAGILLHATDTSRLSIALAEAASQELALNSAFAKRVMSIYEGLPATIKRETTKGPKRIPFEPLKHIDGWDINLATPPDPYILHEVYGSRQLAGILALYGAPKLQGAARTVQDRNPGTKPIGRTKQPLIDYIVHFVVGE